MIPQFPLTSPPLGRRLSGLHGQNEFCAAQVAGFCFADHGDKWHYHRRGTNEIFTLYLMTRDVKVYRGHIDSDWTETARKVS